MNCDKILTGEVMSIGGYYGPIASYRSKTYLFTTPNYLQDKYFQMLKDCGINLLTTVDCDYTEEPENFIKTMELCEKFGIRIFVKDRALETMEGEGKIIRRMEPYSHYKCFAGIRIIDEPATSYYPDPEKSGCPERPLTEYSKIATKLNAIPGLFGYVNLFPYYSFLRGVTFEDYKRYVHEYCQRVPNLKHLSYDHYVFDSYDYKTFYDNMSFIRDTAKEHNVPFWAFVQCGGQWGRGGMTSLPYFPSDGEFYWSGNIALAMGAKGIQYFPTVTPYRDGLNEKGEIDINRQGMIAADGSATPFYYMAKNLNAQIAAVDEVLMNAENIGVLAIGEAANKDTVNVSCKIEGCSYRELIDVEAEKGALIGCFDYRGKTALYVVNYDKAEEQKITLRFNKTCDFKTVAASGVKKLFDSKCELSIAKGEAFLIVLN